jgi:hypothetical protein
MQSSMVSSWDTSSLLMMSMDWPLSFRRHTVRGTSERLIARPEATQLFEGVTSGALDRCGLRS